jgi:hypothetical protein
MLLYCLVLLFQKTCKPRVAGEEGFALFVGSMSGFED